ncbi:hypothetical protein SAMN05216565_10334 [Litchfieldia salsa]|uniref:Uncharacterized protein n=1 Tax=Litchfieldia salsa TaxID=930152 RepID=A0A1H0SN65_9BACI|nr:hypothetical protein SAMN05216565_10334 [Litchfieldia salsa]
MIVKEIIGNEPTNKAVMSVLNDKKMIHLLNGGILNKKGLPLFY